MSSSTTDEGHAPLDETHTERPAERGARVEPGRGDAIGRYVVLSRLGAGAMGVVFAAYDPELDRKVALKLLRLQRRDPAAARARLQREAQALAKLNHPSVVAVHDVGVHQGRVFLAMEFVDGQTLGEWIGTPRPWREIVDVFAAAGEGLQAAHEVGLVHRDFKPDNVMLGDDGRVRVMDFGLARAEGDEASTPDELASVSSASHSAFNNALTKTGTVMGTPAYMAPEQFFGKVTERSDQFSYCVALFEALHGKRPFRGETLAALAFAISEGQVASVRTEKRDVPSVPKWLHRVVLRGLSKEPEDRFSNMAELLAELSLGETRRRRARRWGAAANVALVGATAFGFATVDERQRVNACEAEGASVDALWNDDRRAAVRDGLMGTNLGHAETTANKVIPLLDAYASSWGAAKTSACRHTEVERTWDAESYDRSSWCLEERRLEFAALAEQLARGKPESVNGAVSAALALPDVDACVDERLLARRAAPPPDDRPMIAGVQAELAKTSALSAAGEHDESRALALESLGEAQKTGWKPLISAAHYRVGVAEMRLGEFDAAEQSLEDAYFEAVDSGVEQRSFWAAIKLSQLTGMELERYDDGLRWIRHAESARMHLGTEDELFEAVSLDSQGDIIYRTGDYDQALALLEQAQEIRERGLGNDHPDLAWTMGLVATIHYAKGDFAKATELDARVLQVYERALGDDHPQVAASLNNMAINLEREEKFEQAVRLHTRALGILENALGPEHPTLAATLNNFGRVRLEQGELEEAKGLLERSLAIREKAFGPEHRKVAATLSTLAAVSDKQGDIETAIHLSRRSLKIREDALGADHPVVARSLTTLGDVLQHSGAYEESIDCYERALPIHEALGPEHPYVVETTLSLAVAELAKAPSPLAIGRARRAVEVAEPVAGASLAQAQFLLARALEKVHGPSEESVSLAIKAREGFAASPDANDEVAEINTWIEDNPAP